MKNRKAENSSLITHHPSLISGGSFTDSRGTLRFVNDFDFSDVRRFYQIENNSVDIIRAWQGHKIENKYFFVVDGSFLICGVKIDNWENPSTDLKVEEYILTEKESKILFVPGGYANGFKALEENSKLMVFSSNRLENAKDDDYRFDADLWYDWKESSEV